jgi:hypothetical protein
MAANAMLVLLGALSIAGAGIGAATLSDSPFGGPGQRGCGMSGNCPNGQAGGYGGACGTANPVCNQADNGTCPLADDGVCPYANQKESSG